MTDKIVIKEKKHVIKAPEQQKEEKVNYLVDFFTKSEEIDTSRYHCFKDANENADIVIYFFVPRKTLHFFNEQGMTPYEELRDEKLIKLIFIDIDKPIDWTKSIPIEKQNQVDMKRVCDDLGIIYIVNDDVDKIIDQILELK